MEKLSKMRKVLSAIEHGGIRGGSIISSFVKSKQQERDEHGGNNGIDEAQTSPRSKTRWGGVPLEEKVLVRDLPTLEDAIIATKPFFQETPRIEDHDLNGTENEETLIGQEQNETEEEDVVLPSIQNRKVSRQKSLLQSPTKQNIFGTLSAQMRKKIERLPKPNERERKLLKELDDRFLDMIKTPQVVDVDKKTSLYGILWKKGRTGAPYIEDTELQLPARKKKPKSAPKKQPVQKKRNKFVKPKPALSKLDRLKLQQARTENALQLHEANVNRVVGEIQSLLPESALLDFRINNLSALTKIRMEVLFQKMAQRFSHRKLSGAWDTWEEFVSWERKQAKRRAAKLLQKLFFIKQSRLELAAREEELQFQKGRTENLLKEVITKRQKAAVRAQKLIRGHIGRLRASEHVARVAATLKLQCAWRARKCRLITTMLRLIDRGRDNACINIQRCLRGHWGRIRHRLLKKIQQVKINKAELLARQAKVQQRFKEVGAATLIQGWWRALLKRWYTRAMVRVLKRRYVIKIQSCWRAYQGRLEYKRRIRGKVFEEKQRLEAAILLQKRFRIRNARRAVQKICDEKAAERQRRIKERENQMKDKTMKLFGQDVNVTDNRRKFLNIKDKINPFKKQQQEAAATKIQKTFRGHRARQRVKRLRHRAAASLRKTRRESVRKSAITMQARFRGIQERKRLAEQKRHLAASKLQALFRSRKTRQMLFLIAEKRHAAQVIQRRWRGRLAREMMQVFRVEKTRNNRAAKLIQALVRGYIARGKFVEHVENERCWVELRICGASETRIARKLEEGKIFVNAAFKHGSKYDGELQKIFQDIAIKDVTNNISLNGEKWAKFVLQAPGMNSKLERSRVDTVFATCKRAPDVYSLQWPEFLKALVQLAIELYIMPEYKQIQNERAEEKKLSAKDEKRATNTTPEQRKQARQDEKERIKQENQELKDGLISAAKYGKGLEGKQALFLQLFEQYLWLSPAAKVHYAKLEKRTNEKFSKAASVVQRRFRGLQARGFMEFYRKQRAEEEETQRLACAAIIIQSFWRRCRSRAEVVKRLKLVLQKCIDPDTGDPYWFNKATEASTWHKPSLLGASDVDSKIILPNKEEEFTVICVECKEEPATVLCNDCADPFCENCCRKNHQTIENHKFSAIDNCKECEYQAVTRRCNVCITSYCCTCFEITHKDCSHTPEFASHKWSPLVKLCVECENRAVKWRCTECGDDFCSKCFKDLHKKGKRKSHRFHALPYLTTALAEREQKLEDELLARKEKERFDAFRKERERIETEEVAIKLQAIWRGRKGRKAGQLLLKEARKKERHLWKQTKEDNAERGKLKNKLKLLVGKAPIFETDDEETKALKKMGFKGSTLGKAAIKLGAALPFGEELPGLVKVYPNETYVDTKEDWTQLVEIGEYIRLNNQSFLVKQHRGEKLWPTKLRKEAMKSTKFPTRIHLDFRYIPGPDDTEFVKVYGYKLGRLTNRQEKLLNNSRGVIDIGMGGIKEKAKGLVKEKLGDALATYEVESRFAALKGMASEKVEGTKGVLEKGGKWKKKLKSKARLLGSVLGKEYDDDLDDDEHKPSGKIQEEEEEEEEDPALILAQELAAAAEMNEENTLESNAEGQLPPLPENWQEYYDDTHQAYYYYNVETTETTWERPI